VCDSLLSARQWWMQQLADTPRGCEQQVLQAMLQGLSTSTCCLLSVLAASVPGCVCQACKNLPVPTVHVDAADMAQDLAGAHSMPISLTAC
jgi:hypothetical protein